MLITGATGQLGRATVEFLLKKGFPADRITALVRDESKAVDLESKGIHLRFADYNDYASLVKAFEGVEKLLFVSGNDIINRSKQHDNVVKAAKGIGVKHIIYTSFERKNETETSPIAMVAKAHIETENSIKASGMDFTILRNSLYVEAIPMFLGNQVIEKGIILPVGNGMVSFTARKDIAEAIAIILLTKGHENREYILANTENVSFRTIAGILSRISGRNVTFSNPSVEAFTLALGNAGVPNDFIGFLTSFSEAIKQGEFASAKTDLEMLLGRNPLSVEEYLKQLYQHV